MSSKTNGFIGTTAVVLGAMTITVMAALRTDGYDHLHKAVSELGSVDAPNNWVFNILAYMVPGVLVSVFGFSLLKEFRPYQVKPFPFYLFAFSGLFMALAGAFPADMDHRQSISTVLHSVGSIGGGICWLLCSLTLWRQLRKKSGWKTVAIFTFSIPFVMIAAMGFVPETAPGLSQRVAFAANYLFILVIAGKQLSTANKTVYSG